MSPSELGDKAISAFESGAFEFTPAQSSRSSSFNQDYGAEDGKAATPSETENADEVIFDAFVDTGAGTGGTSPSGAGDERFSGKPLKSDEDLKVAGQKIQQAKMGPVNAATSAEVDIVSSRQPAQERDTSFDFLETNSAKEYAVFNGESIISDDFGDFGSAEAKSETLASSEIGDAQEGSVEDTHNGNGESALKPNQKLADENANTFAQTEQEQEISLNGRTNIRRDDLISDFDSVVTDALIASFDSSAPAGNEIKEAGVLKKVNKSPADISGCLSVGTDESKLNGADRPSEGEAGLASDENETMGNSSLSHEIEGIDRAALPQPQQETFASFQNVDTSGREASDGIAVVSVKKMDSAGVEANNTDNNFEGLRSSKGKMTGVEAQRQNNCAAVLSSGNDDFGEFESIGEAAPAIAETPSELSNEASGKHNNLTDSSSFPERLKSFSVNQEITSSQSQLSAENPSSKNKPSDGFPVNYPRNCEASSSATNTVERGAMELPSDGEFGGFASFDEETFSTGQKVENEEGKEPEGIPSIGEASYRHASAVESSAAGDMFGNFEMVSEAPTDNRSKETDIERTPIPGGDDFEDSQVTGEIGSALDGEFNGFKTVNGTDMKLESEAQVDTEDAGSGSDDDEFGGFGDFNAFEETPDVTSPIDRHISAPADKDVPIDDTAFNVRMALESSQMDSAQSGEKQSPAGTMADKSDDDDFGDFDDFNAFEEPPEEHPVETSAQCQKKVGPAGGSAVNQSTQIAEEGQSVDEDGSDFGDFNAFEEGKVLQGIADGDKKHHESSPNEGGATSSESPLESSDNTVDGFGDFNQVDEAPENSRQYDGTKINGDHDNITGGARKCSLTVLNENARMIFSNVFARANPITSDSSENAVCTNLPFDVPLRKMLEPTKVDFAVKPRGSEQQLANMKQYFKGLPLSVSSTILSHERWYPYSQYEFRRDGALYAGPAERVAAPSVPEVLSIDLPTGFEASNFSPSLKPNQPGCVDKLPPLATYRVTPTVVDFPPSSGKSEGSDTGGVRKCSEESEEMVHCQLSESGRQFLGQIPDLSFMLKTTLSLDGQ